MNLFGRQHELENRFQSNWSLPLHASVVAFFLCIIALPDTAFSQCQYTVHRYFSGLERHNMSLIWFPSGFTQAQSSVFFSKVNQQTNDMFGLGGSSKANNWFQDHREYFDVYIVAGDNGQCEVSVWDSDDQEKTKDEIVILLNEVINQIGLTKCNFIPVKETWATALACLVFPYCIIDRDPVTGANATHSIGNKSAAWFYIGRTANRYEGPHEFIHQGWFHQDVLCDTYTQGPPCIGCSRCLNLDGIPSDRKWKDTNGWNVPPSLLAGWPPQPVEGGRYCSTGVWRSSAADITDGGKTADFDALGYEAMNRAWRKRYTAAGFFSGGQALEYKNPIIQCNIQQSQTILTDYTIQCDATDSSGVQMVEFFLAPAGSNPKILAIDFSPPFACPLPVESLQEGSYYLRAIAWDRAWNWSQYNVQFFISHNKSHAGQPAHSENSSGKPASSASQRPQPPTNLRVMETFEND